MILTVRRRPPVPCCHCRRGGHYRSCLVVGCLPPSPSPPNPFPPDPGAWTRDWDDPARSQVLSATLFGTAATPGCAPAAPAGLCVRRRWQPLPAAAAGNGSNDVGGAGGDGGGDSGGVDGVHSGGGPAPWDEPGVVAMFAASEETFAA